MGGAEAVLLELLRALREARPDWLLHVIAAEKGPLLERIVSLNVACEMLPFPFALRALGESRHRASAVGEINTPPRRRAVAWRLLAWLQAAAGAFLYACQLRRRLRKLQPDIVHSNGMKMHLLGALAKGATPLVWHLHDYLSARPTMKLLLRRLSSRCQLLIANSESVAADARQVLPEHLPVYGVHNAVDPDMFTPEGPSLDLDQLAGLPPAALDMTRVGLVATFAFWKGHEVFLRAAAACRSAYPIRFYVIGGPVYATGGSQYNVEQLRGIADDLGLSDCVGFTGFVEDVPAAMRALDIVVHASTEPEPFGMVIVQALACERAVIISDAGGARELVEPGVTALLHPPGDAQALAFAITQLAADAGLRRQMGATGRQQVKARLTPQQMAERVLSLYAKVVPTIA